MYWMCPDGKFDFTAAWAAPIKQSSHAAVKSNFPSDLCGRCFGSYIYRSHIGAMLYCLRGGFSCRVLLSFTLIYLKIMSNKWRVAYSREIENALRESIASNPVRIVRYSRMPSMP